MCIGRPFFSRAASKIQRIDSVCCRFLRTCIGTWYVAPPTRLERTSIIGITFSTARPKTSTGFSLGRRFSISSIAS